MPMLRRLLDEFRSMRYGFAYQAAVAACVLLTPPSWADPPQGPKDPVKAAKFETVQIEVKFEAGKKLNWTPGFDPKHCLVSRMFDDREGVATFWVQPKADGEFHVILQTKGEDAFGRFVVTTGGAAPPVDPVRPPVDPVKPPADGGFPAGEKLWGVVVVEETSQAAVDRGKMFADKQVTDFFNTQGYRRVVVDQDVKDQAGQTPAKLKPYIDSAKAAGLPRLFVVGDKGTAFPMKVPATPALMLETLRKYAGK